MSKRIPNPGDKVEYRGWTLTRTEDRKILGRAVDGKRTLVADSWEEAKGLITRTTGQDKIFEAFRKAEAKEVEL